MTHDKLKAAAERILYGDTFDDGSLIEEDCRAATMLARAYLASGWSDDFSACPRDRPIETAREVDGRWETSVEFYSGSVIGHASHWREFVPPTPTKGEQP